LMYLLGDIVRAYRHASLDTSTFMRALTPLQTTVDWSSSGTFANIGGHKGALEVYRTLRGIVRA
jgi:hypothetical protein